MRSERDGMNTKTGESDKFKILKKRLTELSVATEWESVREEWKLTHIYLSYDPCICLCTHYPIFELCYLKNIENGRVVCVGNHCVQHFIGIHTDTLFAGYKRIKDDVRNATNTSLATFAYDKGWINDWEVKFVTSTALKRKLSLKQLTKRMSINRQILTRAQRTLDINNAVQQTRGNYAKRKCP